MRFYATWIPVSVHRTLISARHAGLFVWALGTRRSTTDMLLSVWFTGAPKIEPFSGERLRKQVMTPLVLAFPDAERWMGWPCLWPQLTSDAHLNAWPTHVSGIITIGGRPSARGSICMILRLNVFPQLGISDERAVVSDSFKRPTFRLCLPACSPILDGYQ